MAAILDDEYVTVAEAAALLTVHKSTIRRWIDRGALPAYRIGRRRLALKRSDLAQQITPVRAASEDAGTLTLAEARSRRLTPEEQQRGYEAIERLKQLHKKMEALYPNGFETPSWELLHEAREERSRQLQ